MQMLPTRRFVISSAYADFRPEIDAFLAEHAGREVLIIAATRGAADDLLWSAGTAGALGVHRFTLGQTAALLAAGELAGRSLSIADRFASEAVAARVVHELRERAAWKYVQPVTGMPGFVRA